MTQANDRKVILITRQTRLNGLINRYHTLAQAKFYIEHLGADFSDYLREDESYAASLRIVVDALQEWGRYHILERSLLPNYYFSADDIVVVLGQDGLVANTMKYLNRQPVIGINPEPKRWDGILLPFAAHDLREILPLVATEQRQSEMITMAQVTLSDGQILKAVNDFFVGPKSHTSALYEIEHNQYREFQSSSGIIISTGLGSTAWFKSIVTGSLSITAKINAYNNKEYHEQKYQPLPWDTNYLQFAVREPFPSNSSHTELVYGRINHESPLKIRSRMPDNGVIFSDGIEQDYLNFTAGIEATITLAPEEGRLIM